MFGKWRTRMSTRGYNVPTLLFPSFFISATTICIGDAWLISADRIKQLVKQLFFRLNQQQFRNKKYKHKAGSNNKSADSRGHSETTAIDVDAIVVESIRPLTDPAVKFSEPSPTEVSRFDRPYGGQGLGLQEEVQLGDADDVYAVPASPPVSFGPCALPRRFVLPPC